jgi:hypothetical protein
MAKKALLVGINDYAPVGAGGPDLRGCVNDVADMAGTLHALGIVPIRPGQMRILTNQRATKAAILAGFKWLITGAKKGDVLVFHYSGHGSWMADVSGEEVDKKDETICPYDYATAGMIKDDEFRKLLGGLAAGVNLDILFDSCHAGTGTREMEALATASEEVTVAYRYVEPPLDWGFFLDADPSLPVRGLFKAEGEGEMGVKDAVLVPGLNHVLWAGCRDNQTSAEAKIGGVYRGVFTYCYCKALRSTGVSITRRRLDTLVCATVRQLGFAQVPQLEGTAASLNEKVFT